MNFTVRASNDNLLIFLFYYSQIIHNNDTALAIRLLCCEDTLLAELNARRQGNRFDGRAVRLWPSARSVWHSVHNNLARNL